MRPRSVLARLPWLGLVGALACGGPQDETDTRGGPGALAGGTDASAEEVGPPQRGDWLVIHMLSDPENLNPVTSSDAGASAVLRWVFQTLLTVDPETLEHRPVVAAALPEISDDHLRFRFELRPEATFSDGTPLTSEDVEFSLKVIRHPKVAAPQLRNYFDSVGSVHREGEHALRIELREVYFRNLWTLGSFDILPRHYYDPENLLEGISVSELNDWDSLDEVRRERAELFAKRFNESFLRRPLGSGAFVLEDPDRDWVTGEQIVLRHRDGFWAPGDSDLGDAWVDRVVFRVVNDAEAALVALKSGGIDLMGVTPIQARRQTNDERFLARFGKKSEIRGAYSYIGWNQRKRIFQDRRVRRALSHLVDKRNLVDKVMMGLAEPIEGPIFSGRPEFNPNLAPWPYAPDRARELLEEAGWKDSDGDGILDREIDGERVPLRFEIITNAGNDQRKKVGLAVIDSFKRHGIDASFRSVDWSIMLDLVGNFEYDAIVLGWTSGGSSIPPDAYQLWHSSQAVEDGSNFVAFRNAEVDGILEKYRVEFDPDERVRLYQRFQEILYEEQPYTFLFMGAATTVWDRRFAGVRWYEGIGTDHAEWWVPLSRQKYH